MSRKIFRVLAAVMCLMMLFTLCACKSKDGPDPLPDSSADYGPEGWVPEEELEEPDESKTPEEEEEDYLTTQIGLLSEFMELDTSLHYLGTLPMSNGVERNVFLFRLGQNPDTVDLYVDLTSKIGITQEIFTLESGNEEPTLVQSILTNYGTLYIYDFQTPINGDASQCHMICDYSSDETLVNLELQDYEISVSELSGGILELQTLRDNSLGIYQLSEDLWAVPETMESVFDSRETNVEDDGSTTRVNYSTCNNFLVWGTDEVPMAAELTNASIEAYPYYEINDPTVTQSAVMPYMYTITYSYQEGVITAAMDGSTEYLNAREAIENQFVLQWGDAQIGQSQAAGGHTVDIKAYVDADVLTAWEAAQQAADAAQGGADTPAA